MEVQPERAAVLSQDAGGAKRKVYSRLYVRFIFLTLVSSVVPLLAVGWLIYVKYADFSYSRMVAYFQAKAESYKRIVELFLKERTTDLQLIAETQPLDELKKPEKLQHVFDILEREKSYFTDLGVINLQGKHMAYVGPFDLMPNDYSITFWFRELMRRGEGVYVSDMFMGYRKVPHFIMAVLRVEGGRKWILRATIYNEYLSALIKTSEIGGTGEVYLVNQHGFFQTPPRSLGELMEQSPLPMERFHEESGVLFLESVRSHEGQPLPPQLIAYAWLKEPRWMLVVKQDYAEAFMDINNANRATLIFLHISGLMILIVTGVLTRYMIRIVRRRDEEAEELNRQLLQASKMASLGELSSGVAHEINNPLAIMLTENQVIRDLVDDFPSLQVPFKDELLQSLLQIDNMVQRCNAITQSLLRFSRQTRSSTRIVDVNGCLREVVALVERQARTAGIRIAADYQDELPNILANPAELQQVFLNVIHNAIGAHRGKSSGTIEIVTRFEEEARRIKLSVRDTGSGIPREHLEKIFDPFFTTKPPGEGTGLGLSISYSIMKQLGGEIRVRSELGKGSEFTLFFPFVPSNQEKRG